MTNESRLPLLTPGQIIHGCRVERFLGRGGMGEVYLATHLALQRWVALKVLPRGKMSTDRIQGFLREAQLAARISHPNVVVIHDVGEEQGLHFIVMQYVDGMDLVRLLQAHGGPLAWRRAVRLISFAAKGLHAVHTNGLIHRDVKPANIMLTNESRVLMMDFGLVREQWDLFAPSQVAGTPAYMSPEQARGDVLDRRTDIFSLGGTLYYLLTGHSPHEGTVADVLEQIRSCASPAPVERWNREVPPAVGQLIARAMAPYPQARFPTAAVMARELRGLLATTEPARPCSVVQLPPPLPEVVPGALSPERKATLATLDALELFPIESSSEWQRTRSRVGGTAAVVAFLLLGVLWYAIRATTFEKRESPQTPRVHDGMVYIEKGLVQLGNKPEKIRRFLSPYLSDVQLEQAMGLVWETERTVEVPAFWIDQYEVTNAQYAQFLKQTGRKPPPDWPAGESPQGLLDHPVTSVTYEEAEAYAKWAGKQLPSREQWVRAHRGDTDQLFPWGDNYDSARTNAADNPKHPRTSPISSTPLDVSPFQVYNLAGNAAEFLRGSYPHRGRQWRVSKGSSYGRHPGGFLWAIGSAQMLWDDGLRETGLGLRCVREEP